MLTKVNGHSCHTTWKESCLHAAALNHSLLHIAYARCLHHPGSIEFRLNILIKIAGFHMDKMKSLQQKKVIIICIKSISQLIWPQLHGWTKWKPSYKCHTPMDIHGWGPERRMGKDTDLHLSANCQETINKSRSWMLLDKLPDLWNSPGQNEDNVAKLNVTLTYYHRLSNLSNMNDTSLQSKVPLPALAKANRHNHRKCPGRLRGLTMLHDWGKDEPGMQKNVDAQTVPFSISSNWWRFVPSNRLAIKR